MPTNFPTSVDNFTNPTANDSLNLPSHSTQHANANDAIEAVESYLLNGGQGLTLLKKQVVGSAVASVSVTSAFSATYENYLIIYSGGAGSATGSGIFIKFNNSTGSTYNYYGNFGSYGSTTLTATQAASTTAGILVALNHTVAKSLNCEVAVRNPFETSVTTCSARTAGAVYVMHSQGYDSNSASHTGFSIGVDGATMSGGTIYVYGYGLGQ